MSSSGTTVRRWMAHIPADVLLASIYVLLVDALFLISTPESVAVRSVVGLPVLLFVPGYLFLAALFPATTQRTAQRSLEQRLSTPSTGERIALSFGVSLTLLPLLGIVLSVTGTGLTLVPLLGALTAICLVAGTVAVGRRLRLPVGDRFNPSLLQVGRKAWTQLFQRGTTLDSMLNLALAGVIGITILSLTLGLAVPNEGETYTEVAVLAENESGSLTLANYPQNATAGEPQELVLRVTNEEQRSVAYTVVVQEQRVATGDSIVVEQRERVTTLQNRVAAGEQWQTRHEITPQLAGDDRRLAYLVYKGEPPRQPTSESAYRYLYLWMNVSESV